MKMGLLSSGKKTFDYIFFWVTGQSVIKRIFIAEKKKTHTALVKLGLSAILKVSLCSFSHCCFVVKSSASLETVDTN